MTNKIAGLPKPKKFDLGLNVLIDEECWNNNSKMDEPSGAYRISKPKAELLAWDFCKVPIESLNTSCVMIRNLLDGTTKSVYKLSFGYVDVKDVALAHILGMEVKNASGNRYIISSEKMSWIEITQFLIEKYPQFKINITFDEKTEFPDYEISTEKSIKELGIIYRKKNNI